eukprot:TRINITY_DN12127_c0_g3_i2.p1 TRINITY_DN12127_c0_g3~~TRINITY_DN12127_c0_g3_i2.p1  ORF type:complete len:132 (+),score=3.52 TRINITY_DN12127_c0_g3_i2:927-1322(+)
MLNGLDRQATRQVSANEPGDVRLRRIQRRGRYGTTQPKNLRGAVETVKLDHPRVSRMRARLVTENRCDHMQCPKRDTSFDLPLLLELDDMLNIPTLTTFDMLLSDGSSPWDHPLAPEVGWMPRWSVSTKTP